MKRKYTDKYGRVYEIHDSFSIEYPVNQFGFWSRELHNIKFDDSELEQKVQKNRETI